MNKLKISFFIFLFFTPVTHLNAIDSINELFSYFEQQMENLDQEMEHMRKHIQKTFSPIDENGILTSQKMAPKITIAEKTDRKVIISVDNLVTDKINAKLDKKKISVETDQGTIDIDSSNKMLYAKLYRKYKVKVEKDDNYTQEISTTSYQTAQSIKYPIDLEKAQVNYNKDEGILKIIIPNTKQ